jgi:hypothetical protein
MLKKIFLQICQKIPFKIYHLYFVNQGLDDLEKTHHHQATSATAELKKEMSLLQKKILMDTVSYEPLM